MSDLFELPDGFPPEAAQQLVELYLKYFQNRKDVMYPFNHIKVAAYNGNTSITKPQKGLSPGKAMQLRELGYEVEFNLEKNQWTISWE